MCIIVYKPAGKRLPSENILKNCFINNPDGAGIMIKTEKGIQIQKGYMYFKHLKNAITELEKQYNTKELEIAIHFRYATHGTINEGNCHPFPLSRKTKELTDKQGIFDSAIMHNGIISFAKESYG